MSTRLPSGQGEDLVCKQRTRGLGTGGLCRGTFETDEEVGSGSSFGKGGAGLQTSASISSKRPGGPRQHLALSPPLILLFPCRGLPPGGTAFPPTENKQHIHSTSAWSGSRHTLGLSVSAE